MLLYPRNQVSTSAGAEQLSLSVSYCIKSLKFSGTIMSLPFTLWSRRIALHFKKVKHSDLCQEELREEIMSLCRNMQSHTTDPLKYPLYSEQIRGVCVSTVILKQLLYKQKQIIISNPNVNILITVRALLI